MEKEQYKYSVITGQIIGCAMEVHSTLGCGFQEVIYQRCLEIEFGRKNLLYDREAPMKIIYSDIEVGTRRVDFLVEEKVMVEIKAQTELNHAHHTQIINYLEVFQLEIGLLINFGEKSLRFKRFVNSIH